MYIFFNLSNCKQCVKINDTYSEFENIIRGVPLLFNLSINDLFFFILIASVHNFADDNTLSAFAENVSKLINILQSESEVITDWFKKNQMIVNPDKFQVIIIDKKKGDHTNENVVIDNKQIKNIPSVELLGIQLDDKLSFSPHISNICTSAANQLNALIRLQKFLSFKEKKILINSYFMANFNYCPLVWMFSNAVFLKKIENLQKQLIIEPTHILQQSSSCIDLTFTNQPNIVMDSGVDSSLHPKCHHQIIYSKLNLNIEYPSLYIR